MIAVIFPAKHGRYDAAAFPAVHAYGSIVSLALLRLLVPLRYGRNHAASD